MKERMKERFIIGRSKLFALWFLFLICLLWYKMFGGHDLLESNVLLITSILVGLFLLVIHLFYFTQKIIVREDSFTYRNLISKKTIDYSSIESVYFRVTRQRDMGSNDIQRFQSAIFKLSSGEEYSIPFVFIAGKNRGDVLINKAISNNPSILLDEHMEKIKNSDPIKGINFSNIGVFIFVHVAIFFALSIIP